MCFTFIKVKIIQLIFLCTSAFTHNYAKMCVPCEEHTQCKVNFTYLNSENKETFLIWKLDGIGRAICYTSGDIACHPYPGVDPNLKFSIKSGSGNITTEVSILNTKRAGNPLPLEKRWELFAHNQDGSSRIIYTCDFKLYNKMSETSCSHEASHKGLRLKCIVSSVYPKIACAFKFNDLRYKSSTVYNITTLNQNPLMYTTECFVDIPEDVLTPGRLDYKISIWPYVNKDDLILKAGLIVTGNVTLEQPKLSLANCPDTIEVGTYHYCICARADNSDIKTWIYWNTNQKHTKLFDRETLLRELKTNADLVEYTCTATNKLGWTALVKYRPAIKSNEGNYSSPLLAIILSSCGAIAISAQMCVPCEEHTQCKVNFTYLNSENKETFLIWKLDGIGRAICYTSGDIACHPYPGVDPNLKFSIKSGSGNITTEVSILNTTRDGNPLPLEKRWELFAHNQDGSSRLIYTCDFKLYNKVSETSCSHEASHKGLRLKCIVSPVYPKIACAFTFNDLRYKSSTVYNITTLNQNPLMYTTECFVDIPEDVLTPGRLDYKISIWPYVNKDDLILKAGLIVTGNVTLEQPKLSLANCPDTIEVGTYHYCICARADNSDIKTRIYWNTNQKHTKLFDRETLLRELKPNADLVEYTCTARNKLGWTALVKYRPAIKSNEINIKLQHCPVEKPYNCTTDCYGDFEFCLKGVLYSCQSEISDTQQVLYQRLTNRDTERIIFDHCKDMYISLLKKRLQEEGNYSSPLLAIILSSCGAIAISVLISMLLLCCLKKYYLFLFNGTQE